MVVTVGLRVRDPHRPGSWGVCPTALVGLDCPACGSLRAVHHLTHLDLAAAASSNLLLVMALPFAVVLWARLVRDRWRGGSAPPLPELPGAGWWALGLVALAFTVLRNLPAGGWLAS